MDSLLNVKAAEDERKRATERCKDANSNNDVRGEIGSAGCGSVEKPYNPKNMASVMKHIHCKSLVKDRRVVFMGDSVMRCIYKDMVAFALGENLLSPFELKERGENSFRGDKVLMGGRNSIHGAHNGKTYREWRMFQSPKPVNNFVISYHYITKCYNEYVASMIDYFAEDEDQNPDYLIINSCIWDLSRYPEVTALPDYEENLANLFEHISTKLPETVLIWCISPPVAGFIRGGFVCDRNADSRYNTLRYDMIEGKRIAYELATHFPMQLVDLHHATQPYDYLRESDGIHYNNQANRMFTKQILYQMYLTAPTDHPSSATLSVLAKLSPNTIHPEVGGNSRRCRLESMSNEMAQLVLRKSESIRPAEISNYVRDVENTDDAMDEPLTKRLHYDTK